MAKLPDLSLNSIPSPRPSGDVVQLPSETGLEMVPAKLEGEEAQQLMTVAVQAGRAQDRLDTTVVEDAWNKYKDAALEATAGKDGVLNTKGENAVKGDLLKVSGERLRTARDAIEENLSPEQRVRFAPRAAATDTQVKSHVYSHIANQSQVYDKQVIDASVDTAIAQLQLSPGDTNLFTTTALPLIRQIEAYGKTHGVPAEAVKVTRDAVVDQLWTARINAALAADDTTAASNLFKAAKLGINIVDQEGVGRGDLKMSVPAQLKNAPHMKAVETAAKGMSLADEAQAAFPTTDINQPFRIKEMDAFIRDKYKGDPDAIVAARHELSSRMQLVNAEQTEVKASNFAAIDQAFWVGKKTLPQLMAMPQWSNLTGTEQGHFIKTIDDYGYQQQQRRRADVQWQESEIGRQGWAKTYEYLLDPDRTANTSDAQIIALAPQIGRANVDQIMTYKRQLEKPDKVIAARMDNDTFKLLADENGFKASAPPAQRNSDDNKRLVALHAAVNQAVQLKANALKRPLTIEESTAEMRTVLDRRVMVDEWGRDPSRPAVTILPNEVEKVYVPIADVPAPFASEAIRYMKSKGRIPQNMSEPVAREKYGDTIGKAYGARLVPMVTREQIDKILSQ